MNNYLAEGISIYREGASHALAGYQLIESQIKVYIGNHFEIARFILGDRLHLGFTRKDYENAPLGRLLQAFSKLSNDSQLVNDLRAEVPHRDHIAHQSMLILFSKSQLDIEEINRLIDELVERNNIISNLLNRLHLAHESLIHPYQKNILDKSS